MNGIVMFFAIAEFNASIHDLTPLTATSVRWVGLTIATLSSLHMARVIKEVEDGGD